MNLSGEQNNPIDFPAVPDGVRRVLVDVPDGPEGIRQTMLFMRRAVRDNMRTDEIKATAAGIIGPEPGFKRQAELIHNFCRDRIRYLIHPEDLQLVRGPIQTLQLGAGDCVNKCVLEAALLKACGHDAITFVAMAEQPDAYSHVYLRTQVGPNWIASDPTVYQPFGWEPTQNVMARMLQRV